MWHISEASSWDVCIPQGGAWFKSWLLHLDPAPAAVHPGMQLVLAQVTGSLSHGRSVLSSGIWLQCSSFLVVSGIWRVNQKMGDHSQSFNQNENKVFKILIAIRKPSQFLTMDLDHVSSHILSAPAKFPVALALLFLPPSRSLNVWHTFVILVWVQISVL